MHLSRGCCWLSCWLSCGLSVADGGFAELELVAQPGHGSVATGVEQATVEKGTKINNPPAMHPLPAKLLGQVALLVDHRVDQQGSWISTFRQGVATGMGHRNGSQESLRSSMGRINRNNPLARMARMARQVAAVRSP